MNNILSLLDSLLVQSFKNGEKILKEEQKDMFMSIPIEDKGVVFSSYSFDKKDIFPFLNKIKGAHSMCDYILFCTNNNQLYILLIELKHGNDNVMNQIKAGKNFSNFIISTLNRVNDLNLKPQIRSIAIRNKHISRKGRTNCEVKYDENNFCTFGGNTFVIKEFLK
mgnify:FL=1